ncbi:hypothetical protein E2C01_054910 [Portunus trituberculatus]|uniref:Uncharacterized protein n=1 Tax=Portunus trituberculatus TaxID=210409 RepID=A0A5B7GL21_PORTR|nr:hypothetical protein [Portunus trituberculatus]
METGRHERKAQQALAPFYTFQLTLTPYFAAPDHRSGSNKTSARFTRANLRLELQVTRSID